MTKEHRDTTRTQAAAESSSTSSVHADAVAAGPRYSDGRTVVALFALFSSLISWIWEVTWASRVRREDRRQSVVDDVWLRQVFYPLCIQPLLRFAMDHGDHLAKLHAKDAETGGVPQEDYRRFLHAFQIECNAHHRRVRPLGALDPDIESVLTNLLDDLEDAFAQYCYEPSNRDPARNIDVEARIALVLRQMVERLITTHGRVGGPTTPARQPN